MLIKLGIVLVSAVALATALEHYEKYNEGSCSGIKARPIKASREWVHSLEYMVAGNREHMYRLSSSLHNYYSIREHDFYYHSCYTRNSSEISKHNNMIGIFGYGKLLGSFDSYPKPGIYIEAKQGREKDVFTVSLTDHKSFAFLDVCRTKVDQRGWVVVANTPNLSKNAMKMIEEHAAKLGYKKENFVFLRYDSCKWANPLIDHHHRKSDHHDDSHELHHHHDSDEHHHSDEKHHHDSHEAHHHSKEHVGSGWSASH